MSEDEDLTAREWMTLDEVGRYTGQQLSSVYKWMSRWEVRRQTMALTEDVVRAKLEQPGVPGRPRKVKE